MLFGQRVTSDKAETVFGGRFEGIVVGYAKYLPGEHQVLVVPAYQGECRAILHYGGMWFDADSLTAIEGVATESHKVEIIESMRKRESKKLEVSNIHD